MITLQAVAGYVPETGESNHDKREKFALTDEFLRDKIGVDRVTRLAEGQDSSDMCVLAFHRLVEKTGLDPATVDCVIAVTQNPDGNGIPHLSAIVHGKLGLPTGCAAFDISLGCSGYVNGLAVAQAFMEANGLQCGLLFTCDPYSKMIDPDDRDTVLLFGDAATVSLLRPGPGWRMTRARFATMGRDGKALTNASGRFVMNGRAVFNFSATAVPPEVAALLSSHGIAASDVDLFLLHQGSRFIVDTLRKRMGLGESQVPLKLEAQGNTVSSSIPLLLEDVVAEGKATRCVLAGFGVGLAIAVGVLEWQSQG